MQTKSASIIEEIFIKASISHNVTKSEWQKIEYAIAEDCVSLEERLLIRRIQHSVYRGWFRVLGEA